MLAQIIIKASFYLVMKTELNCNKKIMLLYYLTKKHETARVLAPDIDGNILPYLVKKIPV